MKELRSRRAWWRSVTGCIAGSRLALGQRRSPAGAISVSGSAAIFSVEYGRPMESVAYTFIQAYGWRITFDEAPIVHAEDMVEVTRDLRAGIRVFDPRGGHLEFTYELQPGTEAPGDPERVLRTAMETYNRSGFPGRYDLVAVDGYFHIVPIFYTDASGAGRAGGSPLDSIVTVIGGGRGPQLVLRDLVQEVESVSGFRILVGRTPFLDGVQPVIDHRFENMQARSLLKALIDATGKRRIWYLMCDPGKRRYGLSIL